MKVIHKLAPALFFFSAALLAAPFASAQSAFDGTWHADKVQITGSMVLLIQDGVFDTKGMPLFDPEIRVKADGTDQPVPGHSSFDTISVRELTPDSMTMTLKKNGTTVRQEDDLLSQDGNAVTGKGMANASGSVKSETILKRLAPAPAGADTDHA